jgi:hypothetical protein
MGERGRGGDHDGGEFYGLRGSGDQGIESRSSEGVAGGMIISGRRA